MDPIDPVDPIDPAVPADPADPAGNEDAPDRSRATGLLRDWGAGDRRALDQLVPAVYEELRRLAGRYLRLERGEHTLQSTALVHEAYLRLIDQRAVDWRNRAQFLGIAAQMMRRVLANHARDRAAQKRGGGGLRVTLASGLAAGRPDFDLLALAEALERLEALEPRKSRVVELKYFGGLTTAEIGTLLEISPATVEREWKFSRAWLYDALSGGGAER